MLGLLLVIMVMTICGGKVASPSLNRRHHAVTKFMYNAHGQRYAVRRQAV